MYLGECDTLHGYEEMGLGKLKLKNVVKSVTKAATQVVKVAIKPTAIAAASSLQAVGLRNIAEKAGKAAGLTQAERKIAKVGGTVIDVGAGIVAATVAAPIIASAAGTAAHAAGGAAVKGLLLAKTLGQKGGGLLAPFASVLRKKKTGPAESPDASDQAVSSAAESLVKGAKKAGVSYIKKGLRARAPGAAAPTGPMESPAAVPGGDSAPGGAYGGASGGASGGPGPSYDAPPSGGDSAPADGDSSAKPPEAAPEPKKVPTWLLFAPALLLL